MYHEVSCWAQHRFVYDVSRMHHLACCRVREVNRHATLYVSFVFQMAANEKSTLMPAADKLSSPMPYPDVYPQRHQTRLYSNQNTTSQLWLNCEATLAAAARIRTLLGGYRVLLHIRPQNVMGAVRLKVLLMMTLCPRAKLETRAVLHHLPFVESNQAHKSAFADGVGVLFLPRAHPRQSSRFQWPQ